MFPAIMRVYESAQVPNGCSLLGEQGESMASSLVPVSKLAATRSNVFQCKVLKRHRLPVVPTETQDVWTLLYFRCSVKETLSTKLVKQRTILGDYVDREGVRLYEAPRKF